ncbi:MAG: hypothetical protein KGD73_13200 [Candidatus Lokiarchaeota archaeon]|nr:hypothetical protein [Candidatus Lokiarchaeota archaeon]
MTGTSPFLGAAQFGKNARIYRKKFMNNTQALLEIMEACYEAGGRGIQMIPVGKVGEAAKIMSDTHDDYVIIGSTAPGPNPLIEELVESGAKIIFAHGTVSDKKDEKLIKMIDDIASRGIIPGIAAHSPVSTLNFAFKNTEVKTFLIPFNETGLFMGDKQQLEEIVNSRKDCYFVGMKTLSAGKSDVEVAYNYIAKHNICAVTIGMVTIEEAKLSTKVALKSLNTK